MRNTSFGRVQLPLDSNSVCRLAARPSCCRTRRTGRQNLGIAPDKRGAEMACLDQSGLCDGHAYDRPEHTGHTAGTPRLRSKCRAHRSRATLDDEACAAFGTKPSPADDGRCRDATESSRSRRICSVTSRVKSSRVSGKVSTSAKGRMERGSAGQHR